MTEYYLDIETTGLNPNSDQIITIQYQKLDPLGKLRILKSWESSESKIIEEFLEIFLKEGIETWKFIPVGYNLNFDFRFLSIRAKEVLEIEISRDWFDSKPKIDIKDTYIIARQGEFRGTTLTNLVKKQGENLDIPQLFLDKKYQMIENYVVDETKRFIHLYLFLKHNLGALFDEYKPLQ